MGCLGVHYAIDEDTVSELRQRHTNEARLDFVQTEIEESFFESWPEYYAESDKAWDAIHRVLSDGLLSWDGGTYPLNHTVLAGELLYDETDYIMSLKSPSQVRDVNDSLALITREEFRARYDRLDPNQYDGEIGDEDFEYTWDWFTNVRDLFREAAYAKRYVLFTADQ